MDEDSQPAEQTNETAQETAPSPSGATAYSPTRSDPAADLSHDEEAPRGDAGAPHQDEPAEMTIIGEPEAYATTEPVMASDQTSPVSPDSDATATAGGDPGDSGGAGHGGADHLAAHDDATAQPHELETDDATAEQHEAARTGDHGDSRGSDEQLSTDAHAPAEAGAAVVETDDDRSAADRAAEPAEERFDPTPTRDWAADEEELLKETRDRGERLEAERAELAREAGSDRSDDSTSSTAADDETRSTRADDETGSTGADDATGSTASDVATGSTAYDPATGGTASSGTASGGRRVSSFHELRDGGFGVGSAAPLDDGAQPLDHPVQGDRETMTYRVPGDTGYDSADPHVWFYDEGAAERNGFRHVQG